jgi:hypothetical protein
MTLVEYCGLRLRNRPREPQRGGQQQQQGHNMDFIRKVGKLTIPSFDGSSKCTARAWVQKLDTYYKLNQMTETEAISFATLHLEGEAHEWWHHGLVTLGHSHITSYREFTERLMDRFDRRDPEIHFRDLASVETNWHSRGIHHRVSAGSSGSDRYLRAQVDYVVHRGAHRTLERMGEGIQASHLAGCHLTHSRFGRLKRRRLNPFPNPSYHRGTETGSHSRESGRARRSWMMRRGESL